MEVYIEVGSKVRFIARPEHYANPSFKVGGIYTVADIVLHNSVQRPAVIRVIGLPYFLSDRFFELVEEELEGTP